jgi:AcrR family transcriptional regulator
MSTEDVSVQGKIIDATIECIEREGIQAVTIRKIAKLAGVNSAAINYYFRSKEKLVEEVKRSTLEHVFEDWREILNDESRSVRERLFLLFTDYMEGAVMYPGISKAHMWEPLVDNNYDSLFVRPGQEAQPGAEASGQGAKAGRDPPVLRSQPARADARSVPGFL